MTASPRSKIIVDRQGNSLHRDPPLASPTRSMHNYHNSAYEVAPLALPCWPSARPHGRKHADPFGPGTGASTALPAITVIAPRALEAEPTDAASEKRISGETLNTRPLERPGDMLEAAPGLVVTQHSGEGKANQYFLRGMNLDHGTDLAIWLDGMPINMRTHGHGQGYADINFLIPELVEQMIVKKGPYWAEEGDFASAGSLRLAYADRLETQRRAGDRRQLRLLARAGGRLDGVRRSGSLTAAGEIGVLRRPLAGARQAAQVQRLPALQRRHARQRAFHHRAGLHQFLAFDRPDPRARRLRRQPRPLRRGRPDRRRRHPALFAVDALAAERRAQRQPRSRPTASTRRSTSTTTSPTSWTIPTTATSSSKATSARSWA